MVIVGGEFSADNEIKTFIQKLLQIKNDETKYFGVAGWFPDPNDPDLIFLPIKKWILVARGIVQFGDQGHIPTGSKVWNIDFDGLMNGVKYVRELETSGKKWNAFWDNCTDEAIIVGNKAGVRTISYRGVTTPKMLSDYLNKK